MEPSDTKQPHRKRAQKFNVAGHAHFLTFSCYRRFPLLTNDAWRSVLAKALQNSCAQYDVAVWAYVFMPEHVHLLLKPQRAEYSLAIFEQSLKTSSAKSILNALKRERSPLLERLRVQERPGRWIYRFWQEGGGHDFNIWNIEKAVEKAKYCHCNPVKRGLVKDPARWRWSSFRWLELGTRVNEPVALDDWDERLRTDLSSLPGAFSPLSESVVKCNAPLAAGTDVLRTSVPPSTAGPKL